MIIGLVILGLGAVILPIGPGLTGLIITGILKSEDLLSLPEVARSGTILHGPMLIAGTRTLEPIPLPVQSLPAGTSPGTPILIIGTWILEALLTNSISPLPFPVADMSFPTIQLPVAIPLPTVDTFPTIILISTK